MIEYVYEPRAWYSSTKGFIVNTMDLPSKLIQTKTNRTLESLPMDARELGVSPTQWAYDQACSALKEHRERADNYEGRMLVLVTKIHEAKGLGFEPQISNLESLVDYLIQALARAEEKLEQP
jgi:hypothetical protein